jgi:hypothetical protein
MLRRFFGIEIGEPHEHASDKLAGRLGVPIERLEEGYSLLTRLLSRPYSERRDAPEDDLKRETYDAIARLIVGMSQTRPRHPDRGHPLVGRSRDLLAALVATPERSRIMVLSASRGRPAWRTRRLHGDRAGPLGGRGTEITRAIVAVLPRDTSDRVALPRGSPFFAEEFTRALVEEGELVCENGTCRLARAPVDIPIPSTVQEVIAARLDRLPPPAKRLLQVAAVLGRQFRTADAAALADDAGLDVAAAVGELERRGLVHRKHGGPDDELRFGESVTQEVAYEGLLLRQRRLLHDGLRRCSREARRRGVQRSARRNTARAATTAAPR